MFTHLVNYLNFLQKFPEGKIMRCPGKEAIEALFMSAVKEVHDVVMDTKISYYLTFQFVSLIQALLTDLHTYCSVHGTYMM